MIPQSTPTWRRVAAGALPVAVGALGLGLCLFGDCRAVRATGVVGSPLVEVMAVLNDAETQWMVFACAGIYFIVFLVLGRRVAGEEGIGTRWKASLPEEVLLPGLMVLAALAYALNYGEAFKSTQALTLLAGAMIGHGVAFRAGRRKIADNQLPMANAGGTIVLTLIVLLTTAAVWQGEGGKAFQYRGEGRWSGPWDNPNTFGMLMGVGVVLALGRLISGNAEKLKAERDGEHPTSNIQHRTSKWWVWAMRLFFLAAAGVMGVGLVRSYSRGAWVGTLMGVAYLLWKAEGRRMKDEGDGGNAEGRRKNAESRCSRGSRVWWAVLLVGSLCVLAFWGFRETEWRVARRAFSVGNVKDFSWRNRASAYEGSLQMMAAKPWLGYGWNQGEKVYEQFYRKPQLAEGAAIQLNDYFTLGTTLGLPALLCFVMYVGLALTRRPSSVLCQPSAPADYRSLITDYCSKTTCQAGALVLLVGFWFDGGLFKLATASTFWILLELGREGNHERHEPHEKAVEDRGLRGLSGRKGWRKALFRVFGVFRGSSQLSAFCFLLLLLGGALLWARERDPFRRVEFTLRTTSGGRAKGMAILPKPVGKHPVVIYLQGSGGSVLGTGNELRQVAELGLAAVGLDYNQTNYGVFEEQFVALHQYLQQQPWAQSNATAWVGFSLGAQRTLSFALRHPELQPQLLVRRAGGWVPELDESEHPTSNIQNPTSNQPGPSTLNSQPSTVISCPVLLIHGERDEVFPVADCKRLAERLRGEGTPVEVRIFPEAGHNFGEDTGPVVRALAEYCAAKLPLTEYCRSRRKKAQIQKPEVGSQKSELSQRAEDGGQRAEVGGQSAEAHRFNVAMRRAGQHRCELWRAVTAFGEPERHTVMNAIGGLEDYDLAHITAAQLREQVTSAWRARRTFPWCRDVPLDVFERFVANRRIYEEPLPAWEPAFLPHSLPKVKYTRDTAEASDAVANWLYSRLPFRTGAPGRESSLPQMLRERGKCREEVMEYAYLGRLAGVPIRPAYVLWPTSASMHWFAEVWSTEENQWHAVDSSARDRPYRVAWVLRVPKATVLSATGERGGWNVLNEQRWEAFDNTVGIIYPSGHVVVRVVDREQPVKNQRVLAQIWLPKETVSAVGERTEISGQQHLVSVLAARTDANGEAQFTLGQSARYPYRLALDKPGESDWQWLAVQSNRTYDVTLHIDRSKPFDKSLHPPPLGFPVWKGNSPP